jgi:hypothetical protein
MKLSAIMLCIFLFGCASNSNIYSDKRVSTGDETLRAVPAIDSALEIIREFSKTFTPDSSAYKGIGTLKNIPDSVIRAFRIIRQTDTLSHKRYTTVIFLKLYLDHLRCCHQSYEIRQHPAGAIDSASDPLLYEFNLATKIFGTYESREFISSGIANYYVDTHKEMLQYPEVKEVKDKIKPIADSIEKHLYWKEYR